MNAFASLKQFDKANAKIGGELKPLPLFVGAIATASGDGAMADPSGGRLMLGPGTWLIAVTCTAEYSMNLDLVELRVVIGGDPRFAGPQAVLQAEVAADAVRGALIEAGLVRSHHFEPVNSVRTASFWGVVSVPRTDAGEAIAELWALAPGVVPRGLDVEFSRAELFAIRVGKGGAA